VLRQLSANAGPTFKPLRQFLQTMDQRKRAIENDPRAVKGAPPAPDPTHISGSGGFTGLELLWNYFFWQSLDLNGYDQYSHIPAHLDHRHGLQPADQQGGPEQRPLQEVQPVARPEPARHHHAGLHRQWLDVEARNRGQHTREEGGRAA